MELNNKRKIIVLIAPPGDTGHIKWFFSQ